MDLVESLKLMEGEEVLAEKKYRFAASLALDEKLRKTLLDLAHEETVHRDSILGMYESLKT